MVSIRFLCLMQRPICALGPKIYFQTTNDLFGDLPGVLIYFDNFLVTGETEEELLTKLRQVFVHCRLHDLKLQLKKC
jgi:hypothetical protein